MSFSTLDTMKSSDLDGREASSFRKHATPTAPMTEAQRNIMTGSVRKALGLESDDLRLGLRLAANRMRRGAASEALRVYVALVLCEPMNGEFQVSLANCALQLGEFCLALQAASVVIAVEPENHRGYYLSGRACLALGHSAEAEEDFRRALDLAKKAKDSCLFSEIDLLLKRLAALRTA